jgi:hypothetical protein
MLGSFLLKGSEVQVNRFRVQRFRGSGYTGSGFKGSEVPAFVTPWRDYGAAGRVQSFRIGL